MFSLIIDSQCFRRMRAIATRVRDCGYEYAVRRTQCRRLCANEHEDSDKLRAQVDISDLGDKES